MRSALHTAGAPALAVDPRARRAVGQRVAPSGPGFRNRGAHGVGPPRHRPRCGFLHASTGARSVCSPSATGSRSPSIATRKSWTSSTRGLPRPRYKCRASCAWAAASFVPFLLGGPGWYRRSVEAIEGSDVSVSTTEFGWHAGGGLEILAGRHFGIHGDYRYTFLDFGDDDDDDDRRIHPWTVSGATAGRCGRSAQPSTSSR